MLLSIMVGVLGIVAAVVTGFRYYSLLLSTPSLRSRTAERKLVMFAGVMIALLLLTAKLWSLHGPAHALIMYGLCFVLLASWLFEQPVAKSG